MKVLVAVMGALPRRRERTLRRQLQLLLGAFSLQMTSNRRASQPCI
jgi:hypothetical protein